jgi:hypothetical protein
MSHTRSFKKSKKQKTTRTNSYKNDKLSKEQKHKRNNTFKNMKDFNVNTCMTMELSEIRKLADKQHITYNSETSKIDLCNSISSHQRNIFIGNTVAPFLKQQIFNTTNIFKNNISNTTENTDCNLCKITSN